MLPVFKVVSPSKLTLPSNELAESYRPNTIAWFVDLNLPLNSTTLGAVAFMPPATTKSSVVEVLINFNTCVFLNSTRSVKVLRSKIDTL